ncbi:MAG: UDP-N-acetylglucosamine 2-epimerase (non-hydrolyzing) [Bacteroidales bacterium]|nr:UDP-N-acetylglucosamine 2-epimerase (non-hydrolyzing) [Bacteroidales bacterium]
MKIFTVIGARPQFIKAAAVSRAIEADQTIYETIVHTGQHFDDNMSRVFFDELNIPRPVYNLNIHSLNHGAMTGRMLEQLEELLLKEKPDVVLVYGDTNSTLAGALAASKLHIPVAHVEAGLRSFNMKMPEEVNRILTDRISTFLFCPTAEAIKNLGREGFEHINCHVYNTGDVMYDAALYYADKAKKPDAQIPDEFILATLHRAENTDDPQRLRSIISAFEHISKEVPIVLPLHPRTRKIMQNQGIANKNDKLILMEPQGYLQMISMLKNCKMVMTDSGGLQKEAYFFRKPCITLRTETEWTELIEAGVNRLGGFEMQKILDTWNAFNNRKTDFPKNLYGNGQASEKIIQHLKEFY